MDELYPPIEPYDKGMLDVGDGNLVYWEACGNPEGKPALGVQAAPPPVLRSGAVPGGPVRPAWLRAEHAARQRPRHGHAPQHHRRTMTRPPAPCLVAWRGRATRRTRRHAPARPGVMGVMLWRRPQASWRVRPWRPER